MRAGYPHWSFGVELATIEDVTSLSLPMKSPSYTSPIQSFYLWYRSILRNAKYRWLIILFTVAYLLSPIDIAPDFIPIIGWLDDGIVATLLATELSQIFLEWVTHRKQAKSTSSDDEVDASIEQGFTVDVESKSVR
jgi:uncharacterized membrane protein YkvA (DUF1232 family)